MCIIIVFVGLFVIFPLNYVVCENIGEKTQSRARAPQYSWHPRVLLFSCLLHSLPSRADRCLDHESLDLVLESADLAHEVGSLVGGDGGSDDGAGDTAGTAESHLGGNVAAKIISSCPCRNAVIEEMLTCRQHSCPRRAGECAREWPEEQCRRQG